MVNKTINNISKNKNKIKLLIIVIKHCTVQVLLFNAYMMVLMEHESICTLQSSINNSDIALFSTVFFHNGLKNKVVGVIFGYPDVKVEEVLISVFFCQSIQ